MRVLVINGPNLDLLGTREPDVYGSETLADLEDKLQLWASKLDMDLSARQSNDEGEIIDMIHEAADWDGIVINPGAFTHSSRAIGDAVASVGAPTVEIHISNIKAREPWRSESVLEGFTVRTIYGRGLSGYRDALRHLSNRQTPFETIRYGPHPANVGDLRLPEAARGLVVVIHGGFWAREWERDIIDTLAVDITKWGYATWNLEYRRLNEGGAWPGSGHDLKMALEWSKGIETVASLPVALVGHSAGGYLALWAAERCQVDSVVGLAPITDLPLLAEPGSPGRPAALHLLAAGAPERVGEGVAPSLLIHGRDDTDVVAQHSARLGETATVALFDHLKHFQTLDPNRDHGAMVRAHLADTVAEGR